MKPVHIRDGYTFLLSVMFIGGIALAVVGATMVFGWLILRSSQTLERSTRAFEMAMTCAEHGLIELLDDGDYFGDEVITEEKASCTILPVSGAGNENRTLCVEGTSDDVTRHLEIIIRRLLPSIQIYAWQEVEFFTSCTYN